MLLIKVNAFRHVSSSSCTCKGGISGKCKHIAAVISAINNFTEETKTSQNQEWGKPRTGNSEKYKKGLKIEDLVQQKIKSVH